MRPRPWCDVATNVAIRETHHLTEAVQQRLHYVYGPYAEPVLHVKPGDIVLTETMDAFEGKLKTEANSPSPPAAMRNDPLPKRVSSSYDVASRACLSSFPVKVSVETGC
jgi:acetamidase/formamidase